MPADETFLAEYRVADKTYAVDAMLVLSHLIVSGHQENPTTEQVIAAVRGSVYPQSDVESLNDAGAYMIGLRSLHKCVPLGKSGAP